MSEELNNDFKEEKKEEKQIIKEESKTLKYLLIVLSVFFGTFLAVYFIVDLNMHRLGMTPFLVTFDQVEKMFDDDAKYIQQNTPAPVKIDVKDNQYIVSINLKSFDNNPKNIDIETEENGIKISGMVKKSKNGQIKENAFYQNVMFPNKIDEEKITKERKGNKLIVTIPFAE